MIKLLKHQSNGFDIAINHYKNNDKFRLNMVTGSGKTFLAIAICDVIFKDGKKIVAVHTNNLKQQFYDEIQKHSKLKESWIVETYQSLVNKKTDCDMLIVDEVHQGGQESEGCYKKIIKNLNPKKILSLSATDYKVDEKLFGKEKYCYGLEQASQDKAINECEIITIDTGLEQVLSNNKKISKKNLAHLYEENKKNNVAIKDKKSLDAIYKNAIKCALDIYKEKEFGNQAIFFAHNIEWCEKARDMANKMGIKSECINSFIPKSIVDKTISSFKNKEFDLLISVNQIREGFDYPKLEIAIDCSPSFSNEGRSFKQKLGRIIRVLPKKKQSRYYIINTVNRFSSSLDVHDSMMANIEVQTRNDLRQSKLCNNEIFLPKGDREGKISKYKLLINSSESFKENKRKSLFELLNKNDPDSKKNKLIEMAKNGEKKPSSKTKLYQSLAGYTNKKSPVFDAIFYNKIKNIRDDWFKENQFFKRDFFIKIKSIKDLTRKDFLYLQCYTSKKSKHYDSEFVEKIKQKLPEILDEKLRKENRSERHIDGIRKNASKSKGFHKVRNVYVCRICVNGKIIQLGRFKTKDEAIKARKEAEKKYWGEK